MKITQKLIIKSLYSVVTLFVLIVLLRIATIFLPPVILFANYRHYNATAHNAQITIWGLGFGKDDNSNTLFLNETRIAYNDIDTWSNVKIRFNTDTTENKIAILSMEVQGKNSNRKPIMLIDSNATQRSATQIPDKKFDYYDKDFSVAISDDVVQDMYVPLIFNTEGKGQCSTAYYTLHSRRYLIPYNRYSFENTVYKLFLEPSLRFSTPQDIVIDMQCGTQVFSFNITLAIPPNDTQMFAPYLINVSYNPTSAAHVYMIPISSHYQNVAIKSSVFSNLHIAQDIMFSNIIPQNYSAEIENKKLTNFLEQNPKNIPFLSQNLDKKSPLKYLFDITLSPKELATLETTLLSSTPDATITIPMDLDIIESDTTQETVEQYVLSLNNYITQLLSLMNTITLEKIKTILPNTTLYELDMTTRYERYKNMLTATILRTQGLIARTIVGEITLFATDDSKFKKDTLTTQPTSWVEILIDQQGWIPINFSHKNYIALYVMEKYYRLRKNKQQPLIPHITKISLITQK